MLKKHKLTPTLMYLMLNFLLSLLLMVFLIFVLTLRFSLNNLEQQIEDQMQLIANTLAKNQEVIDGLKLGSLDEEFIAYLDDIVSQSDDVDVLSIANKDSLRIYHVVHERIGQSFVGDDESRALNGEAYFSDAEGTMGMQHRYFSPVFDDNEVIGFVMCSTTFAQKRSLQDSIYSRFIFIGILTLLLSILLATLMYFFIKKRLHGLDPQELLDEYLLQNEALDSFEEGVIKLDKDKKVNYFNKAANMMLGYLNLKDKNIDTLILDYNNESLLKQDSENIATNHSDILASVNSINDGYLLILKDKSATVEEAEALSGTKSMISALRANNHEFLNKLQIISGLIQMGREQEALSYIDKASSLQAKAISPIVKSIENPNVAALVLAKLDNMNEKDISFSLLPNSYLPRHSKYLSSKELVTLLGNLLENAIEAINARVEEGGEISLLLREDDKSLLIQVADTGVGIKEENLNKIYLRGFSTKGEGRGYGMTMINEIVMKHEGEIELESDEDGSNFTLVFTRRRDND